MYYLLQRKNHGYTGNSRGDFDFPKSLATKRKEEVQFYQSIISRKTKPLLESEVERALRQVDDSISYHESFSDFTTANQLKEIRQGIVDYHKSVNILSAPFLQ